MDKMLTFRLDDIAPGLKRDNLIRFEEVFDKYGIKPMIGIVPMNEDMGLVVDKKYDNFWDDMIRLKDKGWKIALHGYRHVYVNENSGLLQANPFSEFAGIAYEEQKDMIFKGKEILEEKGLTPEYFMAPGHTFDENTLKALVANGILNITDGYSDRPYIRDGVTFYPCRLSDLRVPSGIDTVCIHLNNWDDKDFDSLKAFLDENKTICKSFDDLVNITPSVYDESIARKEDTFRRSKKRRQKVAESERMQRYLQKSYSKNKYVKLVKRALLLPMLLKR